MAWYTPAETKIPLLALFAAILPGEAGFEKTLCDYLGVGRCILGNSGRTLLTLLLKSLRKKEGGTRNEVVIPGYTCYSVAAAVVRAELKIKVYDMLPSTLAPDFDSLKKTVGDKTLAVIAQHLFGVPTSVDGIASIVKPHRVYVIEDAAQALGGTLEGQRLGTLGDFGFFSFGRGKPLPLGGGGAMVGKDPDILSALLLRTNCWGSTKIIGTALTQLMSLPGLYGIAERLPLGLGETVFDPTFKISSMPMGINSLGYKCMPLLERMNTHRRSIHTVYKNVFDSKEMIPLPDQSTAVYTRFPFMGGTAFLPTDLVRLGVRRMYPKAIADERKIRSYLAEDCEPTPGASEIARNLITLPTHQSITEDLAGQIARKVMATFRGRARGTGGVR